MMPVKAWSKGVKPSRGVNDVENQQGQGAEQSSQTPAVFSDVPRMVSFKDPWAPCVLLPALEARG